MQLLVDASSELPERAVLSAGEEELELVRRARSDPRAFAPLYERYLDPIHAFCWRRLGNREAAEDATAVVFRKALERLDSFHGGSFRAWLFTIATNTIRDIARTSHPDWAPSELDAWPDPARGPEESAMLADERNRLIAALASLPPEWRDIVMLRLDGLTCAEVAAMLGPPRTEVAVRQIHRRAMLRLRERLVSTLSGGATS